MIGGCETFAADMNGPRRSSLVRRSTLASSALAALLAAACSGTAKPAPTVAGGHDAAPATAGPAVVAPPTPPAPTFDDPFAALLDERARALITTAAPQLTAFAKPQRTAVIVRVIWQTVASDPVARVEAMAFLLPDGRLRWGVLGQWKDAAALEVASGLVCPKGVLAEGLRRPLAAGAGDCDLPLIPLVDTATLPEVAREDTFRHGYGRADACRVAADGAGGAWALSLDWFGVILRAGDAFAFVSAPTKVDDAALTFTGPPTVTPMALGDKALLVDAAGGLHCDHAADCFEVGARAVLTGEQALSRGGYGRACELGHGLSCIHLGQLESDPAKVAEHQRRAFAAFRVSCDGGDGLDCAYLGIALETGQGVAKNETSAVAAYQRACKADNALGCFNLGGMAREGRGMRKDLAAARKHYQHACDLGDQGGCDAVASLAP